MDSIYVFHFCVINFVGSLSHESFLDPSPPPPPPPSSTSASGMTCQLAHPNTTHEQHLDAQTLGCRAAASEELFGPSSLVNFLGKWGSEVEAT